MIDCSYISHFNIWILAAQCLSKGVLKRDKKSLKQILTAAHRNSSLSCVIYFCCSFIILAFGALFFTHDSHVI